MIIDSLTPDAAGRSAILIAGDLSAWATVRGCPRINKRDRILLEFLALHDVMLMNSEIEQTDVQPKL